MLQLDQSLYSLICSVGLTISMTKSRQALFKLIAFYEQNM
jgi:hypothetical protein